MAGEPSLYGSPHATLNLKKKKSACTPHSEEQCPFLGACFQRQLHSQHMCLHNDPHPKAPDKTRRWISTAAEGSVYESELGIGVAGGVSFQNCLVMVIRATSPSSGCQGSANVFIGKEFWWSEPVSAPSHIPLKTDNAYMDQSVFLCPTRVFLVLLPLFPCPGYTNFCTGWFFQLYFFFERRVPPLQLLWHWQSSH